MKWYPLTARSEYGLPEVGWVLAFNRRAWRVVEVNPVPEVDWDDDDVAAAAAYGGWGVIRPHYLVVDPATGGKRRHFKVGGRMHWYRLPEHYPVCVECAEPYPCLHLDAERASERAAVELDRLTQIGPGCCWSCGERITPRQEATTFPGENLLLPGAPPAAFHLRKKCGGERRAYERRWQAAVDEQMALTDDRESPKP